MNSTDTNILKYLRGSPIFIGEATCAVYPPTLGEIVDTGYDKFVEYINIISMEKPVAKRGQKKDEFFEAIEGLSTFEYFVLLTQMDSTMNQKIREALHFFLHETVAFTIDPCCKIFVGKIDENRFLDETLFMEMREIIRECCWLTSPSDVDVTPHQDDDALTKAIREQMRLNHEKMAHAKRANKDENIEFSDLIASLTLGDCGLNIRNVWDITYYAFHDQLKRMSWHEQFDINHRAAMAGAKIKKKDLKHWIKSIQAS